MLQSMTGFGRGEAFNDQYKITIEIKSVNHRYLDVNVRLPRKLNYLESAVRNEIKKYGSRGKVDIFINLEHVVGASVSLKYNKEMAEAYYRAVQEIAKDFSLQGEVSALDIARYQDVISQGDEDLDEEMLASLTMTALDIAGQQFVETRKQEGKHLQEDLLDKLNRVDSLVEEVRKRSPQIVEEYGQRIQAKVKELLGDNQVDDRVLATEMIVFADKVCVDEEMVRLKTHVKNMIKTLESEVETVGRKLDFLTQEMNREANTILSKANDVIMADYGIELKTEIEKIREQIQNIE
ncbi:MAG: YicC family protein [Eubacterium sp.]|nr:YicC family protein [Eubacterium sp.]